VCHVLRLMTGTTRVGPPVRSHAFAEPVRRDFMSGVRSGVNGTPSFFINGVRYDGAWDEASLLAALKLAARATVPAR